MHSDSQKQKYLHLFHVAVLSHRSLDLSQHPAVQYDVASVYATRLANRPCRPSRPTPKRGLPLENLHVSMTETIG